MRNPFSSIQYNDLDFDVLEGIILHTFSFGLPKFSTVAALPQLFGALDQNASEGECRKLFGAVAGISPNAW